LELLFKFFSTTPWLTDIEMEVETVSGPSLAAFHSKGSHDPIKIHDNLSVPFERGERL